jgi:hypothetical protein
MGEQRRTPRQQALDNQVHCRAELPDGTVLDGLVADVSLGGARITGATAGVRVGDAVQLVFVFLSDEKVGYRAVVRHVGSEGASFGVEFTSEPEPIDVRDS